jgi:hypothetical protein
LGKEVNSVTIGELYDRLSEEQKKKAFFFLFGIVEFYADPWTWFATYIAADHPCGKIYHDKRLDYEGIHRPGGRARLALSWIISMFERVENNVTNKKTGDQ